MTTADPLREAPKPCPFCGGGELIPFGSEAHPDLWAVLCCKCEAEGPEAANAELAITAWNTRAAADRAPEGRDAVLEEAAHVVLCATRVEGKYGWRERSIGELADLIRALKSSAKETG